MWEWHKRSLRVNTRLQRESVIHGGQASKVAGNTVFSLEYFFCEYLPSGEFQGVVLPWVGHRAFLIPSCIYFPVFPVIVAACIP